MATDEDIPMMVLRLLENLAAKTAATAPRAQRDGPEWDRVSAYCPEELRYDYTGKKAD